jgi:hypothetical protein
MSYSHDTVIWLQPWCYDCDWHSDEDRLWCRDNVWGKCEECGAPSVKYLLAVPQPSSEAPDSE